MSDTQVDLTADAAAKLCSPPAPDAQLIHSQTTRTLALKRWFFELFNHGAASPLATAMIDMHFLAWKIWRPRAQLSDYYADRSLRP